MVSDWDWDVSTVCMPAVANYRGLTCNHIPVMQFMITYKFQLEITLLCNNELHSCNYYLSPVMCCNVYLQITAL